MTTTLDARSGSEAAPTVRRVVLRLALGEAVRIVHNPVTWMATAGSLWLTWRWVGQTAPILFRDSVYVVGGLMPLAAAALLLGNFATLREKDTEENQLLESLPNPAMVRTGGLLGAGATWAFVALLVEGAAVWFLLAGEPIGQFRWLELASGPVIVAAAWCGGVLLARWAPWGAVAPLALVALAFVTLVASPDAVLFSTDSEPKHSFEWLALWTPPSSFEPAEAQLFRPVGPRLAYLAVLLAVTAGLALARHLATSVRRLTAVSAAAVLLTAAAVAPTQTPSYWWDGVDWQTYFEEQHCELSGGVTYCAFPGYRDWIPRWHDTIEATRRLVPIEVEHVIQRSLNFGISDDVAVQQPNLVLATNTWDRAGAAPLRRFVLATNAAFTAVGLPTRPREWPYSETEKQSIRESNPGMTDEELGFDFTSERLCAAVGQARTVVALWAAVEVAGAGIGPPIAAAVDRFGGDGWFVFHGEAQLSSGGGPFSGVLAGMSDAALALDISQIDAGRVSAVVDQHWTDILAPSTSSAQLAGWLDLSPPTPIGDDYVTAPCP
jgi:hypothetical protein